MGAEASRNRLVLLSGGLDSGAVLYLSDPDITRALFVDYGQVSSGGELEAATRLARQRGVRLEVANVSDLARLGAGRLSARPGARMADGTTELQREEWFPSRNLLLIAVAGIHLGREAGGELCLGAGDAVYGDSRPTFFAAAQAALRESMPDGIPIHISVPRGSRESVLFDAIKAGLDVRATFSCNRRGDRHCWRCASCRDRAALLRGLTTGR